MPIKNQKTPDIVSNSNGSVYNQTVLDRRSKDVPPPNARAFVSRRESTNYSASNPIDLMITTSRPEIPSVSLRMTLISPGDSAFVTMPTGHPKHPGSRTDLHLHNYYELIYIHSGQMFQIIGNKRHLYRKGSLCLLNRKAMHVEEYSTDFQCVFICFSAELMRELVLQDQQKYFGEQSSWQNGKIRQMILHEDGGYMQKQEYIDFIPVDSDGDEMTAMHIRIEELINIFLSPGPGATYHLKAVLTEILAALSDPLRYNTIPANIGTTKERALFDLITTMIEKKNGRISRAELSSELHYAGAYINKVVHKYSGLNITQYRNSVLMRKAGELLLTTDLPAQVISEQLGFTNRTNFYKQFAAYWKMTPGSYRRNA